MTLYFQVTVIYFQSIVLTINEHEKEMCCMELYLKLDMGASIRHQLLDANGSCLFAAGSPTDTVGSQSFQTCSTRQTPHLSD